MPKIHGVWVPMVTPFKAGSEEIDVQALRSHVDFLIENGVNGLIPCGSTGEFISMSSEERKRVVKEVVDAAGRRVPVYAATGHYTTRETIELSKHAASVGADGLMVITPYYLPRNEDELFEHFRALHAEVDLPIMLYHNPHFSAVRLTDAFIARCYREGLITSVKEGEGEVDRLSDLRYHTDDGFALFYGFDAAPTEALAMVADGWVAGTANLIPAEASSLYDHVKKGDLDGARQVWFKIKPFIDMCTKPGDDGLPPPWLSILKEGLGMRGQSVGVPRRPTQPLKQSVKTKLNGVLRGLGHAKG